MSTTTNLLACVECPDRGPVSGDRLLCGASGRPADAHAVAGACPAGRFPGLAAAELGGEVVPLSTSRGPSFALPQGAEAVERTKAAERARRSCCERATAHPAG